MTRGRHGKDGVKSRQGRRRANLKADDILGTWRALKLETGVEPTHRQILDALGGGSLTTIGRVLKQQPQYDATDATENPVSPSEPPSPGAATRSMKTVEAEVASLREDVTKLKRELGLQSITSKDLHRKIRELENIVQAVLRLRDATDVAHPPPDAEEDQPAAGTSRNRQTEKLDGRRLVQECLLVLEAAGKPLRVRGIYAELAESWHKSVPDSLALYQVLKPRARKGTLLTSDKGLFSLGPHAPAEIEKMRGAPAPDVPRTALQAARSQNAATMPAILAILAEGPPSGMVAADIHSRLPRNVDGQLPLTERQTYRFLYNVVRREGEAIDKGKLCPQERRVFFKDGRFLVLRR